MMRTPNRVRQMLHDEHCATVALMERLDQLIRRYHRDALPAVGEPSATRLLADLSIGVEHEIGRHFAFEEESIFPLLNGIGDTAIGAHLTDEHRAMRPLGARLADLAREASARGFDGAGWSEFRRLGEELCDRLLMHVQKEEMALLPLLEESMDADTEARLYEAYAERA
jgi:iron-sulfur cluster repair protein YtfE (RIC family)